jgi:hypothetical protein
MYKVTQRLNVSDLTNSLMTFLTLISCTACALAGGVHGSASMYRSISGSYMPSSSEAHSMLAAGVQQPDSGVLSRCSLFDGA